jgi:hypothetical protein
MTIFFRILPEHHKDTALVTALRKMRDGTSDERAFDVSTESFRRIPGSPLAYWLTPTLRQLFLRYGRFEEPLSDRLVRLGASTKQDIRFVRLWYELSVPIPDEVWSTYANGSRYGQFIQNYVTLIRTKTHSVNFQHI